MVYDLRNSGFVPELFRSSSQMCSKSGLDNFNRPSVPKTATPSYKLSNVSRWTAPDSFIERSRLSWSETSSWAKIRPPSGCGDIVCRSVRPSGKWISSVEGLFRLPNSSIQVDFKTLKSGTSGKVLDLNRVVGLEYHRTWGFEPANQSLLENLCEGSI